MQNLQKIFITGTNRGLGFQLVKLISNKNPTAELHISSRADPQLVQKKWQSDYSIKGVKCYQIDLNDPSSIAASVKLIKSKDLTFDFVVANAAVGCDRGQTIPTIQVAKSTLHTNVKATIDFIKQFLPILSTNGRLVLVSSLMGALSQQPKKVQDFLMNPKITEEEIINFSDTYIHAVETNDMTDFSWSAYRTSKALLNAWARFHLPKYLKPQQTSITLHPGRCRTHMGGKCAMLSAQDGAQRIYDAMYIKQTQHSMFYNTKYCDFFNCQ